MPSKGIWLNDKEFMRFEEGGPKMSLSSEIAVRSRSIDYYAVGNLHLPNPDPVLKKEGRDIRIYNDLLVDDRVSGSITNRINATLALDWSIDKGKAKSRHAKAVQEQFSRLDVNRIIESIIRNARGFGYGPHEVVWEKRNELISVADIIGKPQRWFVFGQQNDLRFLSRSNLLTGEELPPRRFVCPTNEATYENPYGLGLLSRCFWPVIFKKGGWRFWVQFAEKFGQVWPVAKLPRTATPDQVDDMLDILTRMVQDGISVIPDDGSVDLKESGSKGATSDMFRGIIAEANSAISTVWLGHAGAGESVSGGKLGDDKLSIEVREDLRDADKTLVEAAFNQVIDWFCEMNFGSAEGAPRFCLSEEETVDQAQAERDDKLTNSLVRSGLRLTSVYYQETYNLKPEHIEPIPAAVAKALPKPSPAPAGGPEFADPLITDGPDNADAVTDRLSEEAAPHLKKWVTAARKIVEGAGNLVDLRSDLLKEAGSLDIAPLAATIRDGLLLGHLLGRGEVQDEIAASEAGATFAEMVALHNSGNTFTFAESPIASALRLPFSEAISFFRSKISIPTDKWNDLWLDMHSKGFMIAGAVKGDLLADLRDAVDQAISSGITLADFRKSWDAIVERYGWSYVGGRNWRTRIVYETNVRQAYNAGRWQQVTDPEVLRTRPYLLYKHGDSIRPRPLHLAWDGTVLPADDIWWSTHYPQNGWGCKCKVFSAGERDIARLGNKAKRTAPDDGSYQWADKQGRSHTIPNGIDPGFQYNPGAAAGKSAQILEDRVKQLPPDIAKVIRADIAKAERAK